jgi:hypothetical protein
VDGGSVGEEEEDEESVLKESSALDGFDRSSSWVGTGTGVGFVGESEPMFQKLEFVWQIGFCFYFLGLFSRTKSENRFLLVFH